MSNWHTRESYTEAELHPAESNLRQHPSHHYNEPLRLFMTNHSSDGATITPSKQVPLITTSHASISHVYDDNSLEFIDSARRSTQLEASSASVANTSLDLMPAIIIHSAISTPGDENVNLLDEPYPKMDGIQAHEFDELSGQIFNSKEDKPRVNGSIESADIKNGCIKTLLEDDTKRDNIYQSIVNTHSSILQGAEASNPQCSLRNSYLGRRNITSTRNASKTGAKMMKNLVNQDSNGVHSAINSYVSKSGYTEPRFRSHDSLVKRPHNQNMSYRNGNSHSMNDHSSALSSTDILTTDNLSLSQSIIRQRSGTLDETALSSNHKFRQRCEESCDSAILTTTSNMSKSYNDLSGGHHKGSKRDSICAHGNCKCSPYHPRCERNQSLLVTPNLRGIHNLSSNYVHRSGEDGHYNQHYLLPETRSLQGGRGMRSVSVDDMRMRNGRDDYVWKDGKVQLKNGGISHGESVRYVWKDGHVEKITSDANNEDTQIEILETTDSKACKKINPVFVCIFLIAVIAVVVILPIYFSS